MNDFEVPLQRFLQAQEEGAIYARALAELRAGRKASHWIWFVFPQLAGLGQSEMSRRYAIASPAEAEAYIAHPLLGPRLLECAEALLRHGGCSAEQILGDVDAIKVRSSMTLFSRTAPQQPLFRQVLDVFYDGELDAATERRL